MAKKTDNELSYLQMPIPDSRKYYKIVKRSWSGLNYRQTIDTGELSMEKNISTIEAPYLVPSKQPRLISDKYTASSMSPISLFGFDDFLIVVYRKSKQILLDYISDDGSVYTGVLKSGDINNDDASPRCILQFNKYDIPTDPLEGHYIKKLIILPDRKSMDFKITQDSLSDGEIPINDINVCVKEYYNDKLETDNGGANIYPPPKEANHNYYYKNTYNQDIYLWREYDVIDENGNKTGDTAMGWRVAVPPSFPPIKYGVVYLSRLFGVDDDRIYASGYNDYTNWKFDTIDEYNESNAWYTTAQSNTKAGGEFTGITAYQGHIICFKSDYMHELYNTKNPFRIQDVFNEGTIDQRTIQEVDGKLIFVSDDGVKLYTGSNPRIIDYNLNISRYSYAVAGTDNRCYYLYCEDRTNKKRLFTYDTYIDEWSEQEATERILSFANNQNGIYMLTKGGEVLQLNKHQYAHNWSFETDLITNKTIDIKHVKKLQMFADIESGANIKVYILYDDEIFNEDTSHLVYESTGYGQKPIRVKPRQTASYGIKLHVEGFGYVRLYELEICLEAGGDLYE